MDQFFNTLLLDQRILYTSYDENTTIMELKYDDMVYELSLSGFIHMYPERKKYTLQSAGLYYLACILGDITPSFLRQDIIANYEEFKERNTISKTDMISLILICVPSFLLSVIRQDISPTTGEIMKASKYDTIRKKYRAHRKVDESVPGNLYVFIVAVGAMTVIATSCMFYYVMRNYSVPKKELEN